MGCNMNLKLAGEHNFEFREALHTACLIALAVLYIGSHLVTNQVLTTVTEILAVITLAESLPLARGIPRNISLILLVLGIILIYSDGAGLFAWLEAFGQNVGIITLLVLVPQLAIPLRWERYTHALADFYRASVNNNWRLYLYSTLMTHFLGVILNVGSVVVMYNLVKDKLYGDNGRIVLNAINRGFANCVMWSPYSAIMAVVLSKLHVTWASVVLVNFPLAMIAFASGFLMDFFGGIFSRKNSFYQARLGLENFPQWKNQNSEQVKSKLKPDNRAVLLTMIFTGMGITMAMLLLEWITGLNMILIVCLVAALFPLFWSFLPGHKKIYKEGMRNYFQVTLPLLRGEVVLFLSAGFFAASFANSEAGKYIITLLQVMAGYGQLVIELTILLAIVILAIVGVHPVVSASILASSLAPPAIGLSAESLAAILVMSCAVANVSSPSTAVNMMLSRFSGRNPIEISLRWNIRYVAITGLMLSFIVSIIF